MTAESATRPATADDDALRHFYEDPRVPVGSGAGRPHRRLRMLAFEEMMPIGDMRVSP